MKTLLSIFFGAIIGYVGAYHYYHTSGKISITETNIVFETNWITKTETKYFNETRWITKTNEVWKTNIMEETTQIQPVVQTPAAAVRPAAQQQQVTAPTTTQKPAAKSATGFRGPVATPGGVKTRNSDGKIKLGARRNMDGSIK